MLLAASPLFLLLCIAYSFSVDIMIVLRNFYHLEVIGTCA